MANYIICLCLTKSFQQDFKRFRWIYGFFQ